MIKCEILESIDNISEAVMSTELSVCESMLDTYIKGQYILEDYEGEDLSSFTVFSEGFVMESKSESKKKTENAFIRVMKKIRDTIAKLIATLLQKMGVTGIDVDKIGESPSSIKSSIKKAEQFHSKHPIASRCLLIIGGTGAVYGGSKLVLVGEKKTAMHGFDKYDKEKIKEAFNEQTGELKIPFNVNNVASFIENIDKLTNLLSKKLPSELFKSESSKEFDPVKTKEFLENTSGYTFEKTYDELDKFDTWLLSNSVEQFDAKQTVCSGPGEWNEYCKVLDDCQKRMPAILTKISAIKDIIFNIQTTDAFKNSKQKNMIEKKLTKMTKIFERSTKLINQMDMKFTEFEQLAKTLNEFLNKYYRIEKNVNKAVNDIIEIGGTLAKGVEKYRKSMYDAGL